MWSESFFPLSQNDSWYRGHLIDIWLPVSLCQEKLSDARTSNTTTPQPPSPGTSLSTSRRPSVKMSGMPCVSTSEFLSLAVTCGGHGGLDALHSLVRTDGCVSFWGLWRSQNAVAIPYKLSMSVGQSCLGWLGLPHRLECASKIIRAPARNELEVSDQGSSNSWDLTRACLQVAQGVTVVTYSSLLVSFIRGETYWWLQATSYWEFASGWGH